MIVSDVFLGLSWTKLLLHLLNFTILFVGLWFILYKPVRKAIQDRQERIAREQREAEENMQAAQAAREESEKRLAELDDELDAKRKAAKERADAAYESTIAEANERAAAIIKQAETDARLQAERTVEEAKDDIRDMAVSLAENIIASKIDDVDDKMIDEAIKDWKK